MEIVSSLTTLAFPYLADGLKNLIAKQGLTNQALATAKRALALELRQNLALLDSSLGKQLKTLAAGDHRLVCAVVLKLDLRVTALLFAGVDRENDHVTQLDDAVRNVLQEQTEDRPPTLPARGGRDAHGQVKFADLLGYVLRKGNEMQSLAELCTVEKVKLRVATKWPQRIGNLHAVMLAILQILESRPQARKKGVS